MDYRLNHNGDKRGDKEIRFEASSDEEAIQKAKENVEKIQSKSKWSVRARLLKVIKIW